MEPSPSKTSESEQDSVEEEESEEECDEGEVAISPNPAQQTLSKADSGVALSIVATKIPKIVLAPAALDDLEVGRRKRRRRCRALAINLTNCRYESVRRAARMCGLREVGEDEEWNVYWTDCSVSLERVMDMKRFQKINHFPGMTEICRKDLLARNLKRRQKIYPREYNYGDFHACGRQRKTRTFICKPDSGCQGRGIFITRNPREIKIGEHMICQQYISKPFLIDGFKFDMRIYVLLTSCDPLRIFMYEEGLARFATMPYVEPNHSNLMGHQPGAECATAGRLGTPRSGNSPVPIPGEGRRSQAQPDTAMMRENRDNPPPSWACKRWPPAQGVLEGGGHLLRGSRKGEATCSGGLGGGHLLRGSRKGADNGSSWQVNHSPSFTTDSRLDREVKDALLLDAMILANLGGCDKRKVMEEEKRRVRVRLFHCHQELREARRVLTELSQAALLDQECYEDSHLGGYRRIYPGPDTQKYEPFFKHSGSLFQETAASKAREECARQQREEFRLKQKQREVLDSKKPKDNKEQNPGESAGENRRSRPRSRPRFQSLATHLAYRNRTREQKLRPEHLDTMQPQEIVEEEELERLNALLRRENLIRSLGIVEQITSIVQSSQQGQKKPPECRPRSHQDGLSSQELPSLSLFPLALLRGAYKEQGPPHFLHVVQPELVPRILGPLPSNPALLHQSGCYLQPRTFHWTRDPATFGPCSLSLRKSGRRCFPTSRFRLNSQGQASRRLEAINRAMAGSVPSSLTPKQGYFLQRESVISSPWTECTLPCVVNSEHRAAQAQDFPLCPTPAPLTESATALLDIGHHR
uniref:Tubulin tyrosine ligase like 13 n=1 Tax=Myotis lucifugus TaxID=59463 RepID=G1PTD0_MYOLU